MRPCGSKLRSTFSRTWMKSTVQLLRERSAVETNSKVKKEIDTGLALAGLDSSDQQTRLAAISTLRGNIRQDVRNKLEPLTETNADGTYVESDDKVRLAADSRGEIH